MRRKWTKEEQMGVLVDCGCLLMVAIAVAVIAGLLWLAWILATY